MKAIFNAKMRKNHPSLPIKAKLVCLDCEKKGNKNKTCIRMIILW
jgi:hypothetical protein